MARGGRKPKAGIAKYLEDHPGETMLSVRSCLIAAHSCWSSGLCMGREKTWRRICSSSSRTNRNLTRYITKANVDELLRTQFSACGVSERVALHFLDFDAADREVLQSGGHLLAIRSTYPLSLIAHSGNNFVMLDRSRADAAGVVSRFWVAVLVRFQNSRVVSRYRRVYSRSRISEFIEDVLMAANRIDGTVAWTIITDQAHDDVEFGDWRSAKQIVEASGSRLMAHPYGLQSQSMQCEAESSIAIVKKFLIKNLDAERLCLNNLENCQALRNYLDALSD